MNFEKERHFLINESDIDLLLVEELHSNATFRAWFLSQTDARSGFDQPLIFVGRSISNYHGESDVLIIHFNGDNKRRAILIENKISATPTELQDDRYVLRGKQGIADQTWEEFVTVLVAPQKYLSEERMKFDHEISYEDILEHVVGEISDERKEFKRQILAAAISRSKKPWAPKVDPFITKWFSEAQKFCAVEFRDLPLPPENKGRAPTNYWFSFFLKRFPMSRVSIEIKPHTGTVDLRFNNVDLNSMRQAFDQRIPVGADTYEAKRSCAIRFSHTPANVHAPFETQKDLLRPMMASARLLKNLQIRKPM